MDTLELYLKRWKKEGYRMTKNRVALLELFLKEVHPLSAEFALEKLRKKRLTLNPSTLYRELEFLKQEGVIKEVNLQEKKRLFELSFKKHHHHLYCQNCQTIQEVEMEDELNTLEHQLSKKNKFKILSHSLEFFGVCERCSS